MLRKALAAAAVSVAAAAVIAGCSSQPAPPLTYAPAAYGVSGHCYYVDDPAEVAALQNAGLCPRSWAPTLMPVAWEEEYYSYYDSSAYCDTYVPARVRTVYVQRETSFGRANRAAITTRSKAATYRTSAGTTVKGTQVTSKTRFGSGKSYGASGQKYGGGNLRSSTGSGSSKTVTSGSGSSRSSSSRSGSLRSGSYSGSRSSSVSHGSGSHH